jgi:geranylgeranyl diphosphate synthase, type I
LEELRAEIDRELLASLHRAAERLPEASGLTRELERLIRAGGKRIRPAFCYWGFLAAGGDVGAPIVRAAASLELLHTFAIVHDDIMDASDRRRGEPTINATRGTNIALLAGDLALVLADHELLFAGFPEDAAVRAFDVYSRMRQEVVAGQYLELEVSASASVSEEDARRVARLKSGRYTVKEPLLLGATLAGGDVELVEDLALVGDSLGEAFQLADDLLGTFGDPRATGKPVDADIRSGKRNVLFAKTTAALDGAELVLFLDAWGGGAALTDEEVDRVRRLIESSGARRETTRLLDELTAAAVVRLEGLAIPAEPKAALLELATRVTRREG